MKNNIVNIEEALLGLIISNEKIEDYLTQAFVLFDSDSFSSKRTKLMFELLKDYYEKGNKQIDFVLLNNLAKQKKIDKEINVDYFNLLLNRAGYKSSFNDYLDAIKEFDSKNKLEQSLKKAINELEKENIANSIDKIRNELYNIEGRKKISSDFLEGKNVAKKVIEEAFRGEQEIKGIKTGFKSLDRITAGLQKGDLIIIAARPSVGKTAFALNLAANILLLERKSVVFFSLEMPAEQLIQRMISSISFVDNYKFKNPKNLTETEKDKILTAYGKLEKANFFIDDSGSIKLDEIIWKSRKQKELGKLDLIIIDYMQLIPTDSRNDNRQQEVSKISRSLKQLARELEVPIVALSQLNRRVETRESKKPMMSDLRESGAIEQDADIIGFLYREEYYSSKEKNVDANNQPTQQITELEIAKHRNGAVGVIELSFNTSFGKFSDFNIELKK